MMILDSFSQEPMGPSLSLKKTMKNTAMSPISSSHQARLSKMIRLVSIMVVLIPMSVWRPVKLMSYLIPWSQKACHNLITRPTTSSWRALRKIRLLPLLKIILGRKKRPLTLLLFWRMEKFILLTGRCLTTTNQLLAMPHLLMVFISMND